MKIAIDSYCYHRFFGECYPGLQRDPGKRMTVWDFLRRANKYGAKGVSIEACFLPKLDKEFLRELSDKLDDYGFERVWDWGQTEGLRSGSSRKEARDLAKHLKFARAIGAKVMRIVGGSRRTRPDSWTVHRRRLLKTVSELIPAAQDHGVVMAMENHIDLLADEMLDLVSTLDSPWFGVCLDTANNLRLFEDPLAVAKKLAPWTRATHVKDITALGGNPRDFSFWPSVPLGKGAVDIPGILRELRKARYKGLLAFEVDYLHPAYPSEDRAVAESLKYLRSKVPQS